MATDDRLESLEELRNAIDTGLDIVFTLDGILYNISWREKPFICTCPDGDAVFYDTSGDLIAGEGLDKRWQDIIIDTM